MIDVSDNRNNVLKGGFTRTALSLTSVNRMCLRGASGVETPLRGVFAAIHNDAPGPDMTWRTDDDVVSGYSTATYEANGTFAASARYVAPGPDAHWFTADDVVASHQINRVDVLGRALGFVRYDAPGPDGHWFSCAPESCPLNS